ncbi:MAG: hypothetical protein CXT67_00240 [Methanobacteriota archaeon]|nr:MAG: hypothetical protein CXT67_00240 [Euryarchaeota archaeon]
MNKQGCHEGNPLVFDTGKIKVYAGGTNRKGGWHKMKPVPDLAMGPIGVIQSARMIDILPVGWKSSSSIIGGNTPTVIEIDWPDYSIPSNLGSSWWKALIQDIKDNNIKTISTQCMGGHGRTGVQLAILAHLLIPKKQHTWTTAAELITWVRDNFCNHAVEAKSQQTYVADICGIPVGESVIAVTQTQWSNFDYNDESLLTDDELKAEEILMIKEEKKSKSRRKANDRKNGKPKKHTLDDFTPFGKEVPKINTPIEKGWTIIECSDCYHQQWRKANAHTFTTPCGICDCDNGFLQVDQEFLNGNKTKYCLVTNDMYHQIEMYDENVSYVGEAMRREMNIRRDKNGYETIKIGNRYIPVHLLKTIGDEIVSMKSPAYKQSRSAIQGIEFTGQRKINMEK